MNCDQIMAALHLMAILIGVVMIMLWPQIRRSLVLMALHLMSLLFEAAATLIWLMIIHNIIPS